MGRIQFKILAKGTQLKTLNLSHVRTLSVATLNLYQAKKVNPEVLQILVEGLAGSLTSLDITKCENIGSGDALVAFAGLKELSIGGLEP